MTYREFTSDQVRDGIMQSIRDRETDITESLLKLYAAWYPDDCETLILAVDVARLVRPEDNDD